MLLHTNDKYTIEVTEFNSILIKKIPTSTEQQQREHEGEIESWKEEECQIRTQLKLNTRTNDEHYERITRNSCAGSEESFNMPWR